MTVRLRWQQGRYVLAGMGGRRAKRWQEIGGSLVEVGVVMEDVKRPLWKAQAEQQRKCREKKLAALVRRLARQSLRRQLVLKIDVHFIPVMLGMAVEILEMHGKRRLLAVEAQMAVNAAGAPEHEQKQRGMEQASGVSGQLHDRLLPAWVPDGPSIRLFFRR